MRPARYGRFDRFSHVAAVPQQGFLVLCLIAALGVLEFSVFVVWRFYRDRLLRDSFALMVATGEIHAEFRLDPLQAGMVVNGDFDRMVAELRRVGARVKIQTRAAELEQEQKAKVRRARAAVLMEAQEAKKVTLGKFAPRGQ